MQNAKCKVGYAFMRTANLEMICGTDKSVPYIYGCVQKHPIILYKMTE